MGLIVSCLSSAQLFTDWPETTCQRHILCYFVNLKKIYVVFALDEENKDALKSAISLVHEIALKRNFSVNFEVCESFVSLCTFAVVCMSEFSFVHNSCLSEHSFKHMMVV